MSLISQFHQLWPMIFLPRSNWNVVNISLKKSNHFIKNQLKSAKKSFPEFTLFQHLSQSCTIVLYRSNISCFYHENVSRLYSLSTKKERLPVSSYSHRSKVEWENLKYIMYNINRELLPISSFESYFFLNAIFVFF